MSDLIYVTLNYYYYKDEITYLKIILITLSILLIKKKLNKMIKFIA